MSVEKRHGCVWVACQSNMHVCCLRFLCMCSALYYRWKWLEGHTSSAPQNTILRSSHSYTDFVAWFARIVTGKHLCTVIWDAHFILRYATWCGIHRVFFAYFELKFKMRISNFRMSKYALCRRVKTVIGMLTMYHFAYLQLYSTSKLSLMCFCCSPCLYFLSIYLPDILYDFLFSISLPLSISLSITFCGLRYLEGPNPSPYSENAMVMIIMMSPGARQWGRLMAV